jgi:hypothetical protein
LVIAVSILVANPSFALGVSAGLDLAISSGSVGVGGSGTVQTLNITPSARIGIRLGRWFFAGVRSAYMQIEQTSEPSASTGNRRGTWFMPIAPEIGVGLGKFKIFADYESTGDYKLALSDSLGRSITYKSPAGFGIQAMYSVGSFVNIGVRYQSVDFAQEQIGSGAVTNLSSKLTLSAIGGVLDVRF